MSSDTTQHPDDRYRALLEAGGSFVFATSDPSGRCDEAAQWIAEFTGVERRQDEHPEWWLEAVHPDDRERVRVTGLRAYSDLAPFELEFRLLHATGAYRTVALRGLPLRHDDGSFREWVGLVLDISDRKGIERELRDLTATLEERVAERTLQLRALAHALTQAEERERQRLARLLHDHLQQLLVAAKINIAGLRPGNQPETAAAALTRLEGVLDDAIDASRSLAYELSPPVLHRGGLAPALQWLGRHMEATHELPVWVRANVAGGELPETLRVFLFQAARELLFNVVKHAHAHRAEVVLERADGTVSLAVVDDGDGMGLDEAEEDVGGFGLFGIRERAALLGGELEIGPVPAGGTRVAVRIPLADSAAEHASGLATEAGVGPPAAAVAAAAGRRLRVLLADDHQVVRQGLRSLLEREADLEVVGEAEDGRQALEAARRLLPDVVVMDVSMPVMDGIEATRRLQEEMPQVRVVGLSLHDDDDVAEQMRAAGAVAHLSKSGPSDALLAALASCRLPVVRRV